MFEFLSGKDLLKVMLFASFALFIGSCTMGSKNMENPTSQLQERIGEEFVQSIKNGVQVSVARVEKGQAQQWTMAKKPHVLTKEKVDALRAMLLNDAAYVFNKTKKCLFIPAVAFRIEGENEFQVLISPSCNQIKFIDKGRAVILDYDPMAEQLNAFSKEILEQLE